MEEKTNKQTKPPKTPTICTSETHKVKKKKSMLKFKNGLANFEDVCDLAW